MHHHRGAKPRFVGKSTPLEAPSDRLGQPIAYDAPTGGAQPERALYDGGKRRRDSGDMHPHHGERTHDVQQCHGGDKPFRHSGYSLEPAQQDHRRHCRQHCAGDGLRHAKSRLQIARDGIELAQVADAKACQRTERGKQHRQHPPRFAAKAVPQVVHRPAAPAARRVFAAVVDAQHVLGVAGHHAQQRHDPHPEHRPRPAGKDGGGHPHKVAGADGGRQRGAQALKLADGLFLAGGMGGDAPVGQDGTEGVPHPVAPPPQLEASGAHRQQQPGAEEQPQPHRPPHDAVQSLDPPHEPLWHPIPPFYRILCSSLTPHAVRRAFRGLGREGAPASARSPPVPRGLFCWGFLFDPYSIPAFLHKGSPGGLCFMHKKEAEP